MKASKDFNEIVGIIGGLGPEATNYFTSLLIKLESATAKKDQDHIPFLVFNNPQIPDRTEHLLEGKKSPLGELIYTGRVLKNAGATFLVMPCNTSHAFANQISQEVGLEVANMIELTAHYIIQKTPSYSKVGLLATNGTVKSFLYQETFRKLASGVTIILPDEENQRKVTEGIYSIKSSSVTTYNFNLLYDAAESLINKGADAVILACTEIPLALTQKVCQFPVIDPMEILAQAVIERTRLGKKIHKKGGLFQASLNAITLFRK